MPLRDVIGHSALVAWWRRRVAGGRLPHALLLVGPRGVGKRFLAQQAAQALLCGQPVEGDACGRCDRCGLVVRGRHPDALVVELPEPGRQITIEQVRQLQRWLALTPLHGRRKVAIMDDADTMQEDAASALLKTLEEPPAGAVLLLIGTHEHRFLPTIVSRCARLRCGPLPPSAVQAVLAAEGVAPWRAAGLARRCAGRIGAARRLADPEVARRDQAVVDEWVSAVEQGEVEPALAARPRPEVETALETIAAWYHDLLLAQVGAPGPAYLFPERLETARAQAARWSVPRALEALDAVAETRALVAQRVNVRVALAALITRLQS